MARSQNANAMDSSFEVGDVVRFSRGEYSHLAIYIGARRVIHLWSPTQEGFCVRVDAFDTISMDVGQTPENFTRHMDEKVRRNHQKEPLNGDEIVRRAMSRIDDTHYDVLTYNCEHFVTWARYDQCISLQVRSHANQVIAGALLGAVFAGTAGLIVGGIISLFTKKDALFASCNSISGNPQGVEQQEEEIRRRQETTRERRRRIWREIEAAENEQTREERFLSSQRSLRQLETEREYSEKTHFKLANRMAEENLRCGICFDNLWKSTAFVFPCVHYACKKCFLAFDDPKKCPYCRVEIPSSFIIHDSTKERAQQIIDLPQTTHAT